MAGGRESPGLANLTELLPATPLLALFLLTFVLPLLMIVAVAVGVVGGRPEAIGGDLGVLVATYGVGLGLVLPVSVRAAYALPESTSPFSVSSCGGAASK